MTYTVHTKEFPHGITARVAYDECPVNPREDCEPLFTLAIHERAQRRYGLGGAEQDFTFDSSHDLMLRLLVDLHPCNAEGRAALAAHEAQCGFDFDLARALSPEGWGLDEAPDDVAPAHVEWERGLPTDLRYEEDCGDYYATDTTIIAEVVRHYILQPLYIYDHSGITISTSAFSCQWDSDQIGWMYISRKDAAKHWPDAESDAVIRKAMDAELAEYDAYLRGECYIYEVTGAEGEYLESASGYIGDLDYVIAEAERSAQHYVEEFERSQIEGVEALELNPEREGEHG